MTFGRQGTDGPQGAPSGETGAVGMEGFDGPEAGGKDGGSGDGGVMEPSADGWSVAGYFAALAAAGCAPSLVQPTWPNSGIVLLFLSFGAISALVPFCLVRLVVWRAGLGGMIVEVLAGVVVCALAWGLLIFVISGEVLFRDGDPRDRLFWLKEFALMGSVAGVTYWAVGQMGRWWRGVDDGKVP